MGNNALMNRLLIESLTEITLDQFWTLPVRLLKSWIELEARFLACSYKDDTKVSTPNLIEEKQKKGKYVKNFIKRFRNHSQVSLRNVSLCYYKFVGIISEQRLKPIQRQSRSIHRKNCKKMIKLLRNQSQSCQPKTKVSSRQRLLQYVLYPNLIGRMCQW